MSILAALDPNAPRLIGSPAGRRFVEVPGERMALFGAEQGPLELWMWPLKVLSDLRLALVEPEGVTVTAVEVRPGTLALVLDGDGVAVRIEAFACLDRAALVLVPRLERGEHARLELSFRCDFRPMWPAGLGGQLSGIDPEDGAFWMSEELGRFAFRMATADRDAFEVQAGATARGVSGAPVKVSLDLVAGREVPLVLAGAHVRPPELDADARIGRGQAATGISRAAGALAAARATWQAVAEKPAAELAVLERHWSDFLARTTAIATPDTALDEAFLWSKIAIHRAWIAVEGLGRGLVAGLGPSAHGDRPGYAWFFDGDALCGARALDLVGDREGPREVLRFAASHQRVDGMMMHELSLSAGLCDWLGDYPYAYYKAPNTPDFVSCLAHHVERTGDLELARELWPAAVRAIAWCEERLDAAGRFSNERAGLGAVEAGALSDRIASDAFLHGAWIEALQGAVSLAHALDEDAHTLETRLARAEQAFETFWSDERGRYAFAHLRDGTRSDALSVYVARALVTGVGDSSRALATLAALNGPTSCADWGARMFATDSEAYDPESYNTGAVFPYLNGFFAVAQYRHGLPGAAWQLLASQAALLHRGGLGFIEEHLEGRLARIPARGVAHQVFSSTALVESVVAGLFGVETDACAGRVTLRPALPATWPVAELRGLRVGETVLDVTFRRHDGLLSVACETRSGPPVVVAFAPVLPPLSRVRGARTEIGPGGTVRVLPIVLEDGRAELEVLEGPSLQLAAALPVGEEESRAPRLIGQETHDDVVTWMLAGRAGSQATLGFHSDLACAIEGAGSYADALLVAFPEGSGGWTELGVRARLVEPRP
jgi:glycogen debranching enzyme